MKSLIRKVKDQAYDPIEVKVREATSNDPWGPSSTLMSEIAEATNDYTQYPKLLAMIYKRINDHSQFMHVKKALILLEYLLKNGSDTFVRDANIRVADVSKLKQYKYFNIENQDIAEEVRLKAKAIIAMLSNSNKLNEERDKAKNLKGVYAAHISSTDVSKPTFIIQQPRSTGGDKPSTVRDDYDNYSRTSQIAAAESRTSSKPTTSTAATTETKQSAPKSKGKAKSPDENPFDDQPADDGFADLAKKHTAPTSGGGNKKSHSRKHKDDKEKPKDGPKDIEADLADALGSGSATAHYQARAAGDVDFLGQQMGNLNWEQNFDDDQDDHPATQGRVEWGPDAEEEAPAQPAKPVADDPWQLASFTDLTSDKKAQAPKSQSKPGMSISELMASRGQVTVLNPIPDFAPSTAPSTSNQKPIGLDAFFTATPPATSNPLPGLGPGPSYGYPNPGMGYPAYPQAQPMGYPQVQPGYGAYPGYPPVYQNPGMYAQPSPFPATLPVSSPNSQPKRPAQQQQQSQNPFDF